MSLRLQKLAEDGDQKALDELKTAFKRDPSNPEYLQTLARKGHIPAYRRLLTLPRNAVNDRAIIEGWEALHAKAIPMMMFQTPKDLVVRALALMIGLEDPEDFRTKREEAGLKRKEWRGDWEKRRTGRTTRGVLGAFVNVWEGKFENVLLVGHSEEFAYNHLMSRFGEVALKVAPIIHQFTKVRAVSSANSANFRGYVAQNLYTHLDHYQPHR